MLLNCPHLWSDQWTNTLDGLLSVMERFCAPGMSPREWGQRVRWTSGDATLERIAFIDWKDKVYFAFQVDDFFLAL